MRSYYVDPAILSEAERIDTMVGIDLLALGKPGGDIIRHWNYYEHIRDRFENMLDPVGFNQNRQRILRIS